jgi:glucose-6-phosphate dehydrogenase assembly protein OpcA
MASALTRSPTLVDVSIEEVERRLEELRAGEEPAQRTSVLTHMAWVPAEWAEAAERVLEGLGPRVPSRTILLFPDASARGARIDAEIEQECFPVAGSLSGQAAAGRPDGRAARGGSGEGRAVCAEVVRLWLRGAPARAPASVVVPLHIPDLPVFLRWRGRPPFGRRELVQLVAVSDRLIVDSDEWRGLPRGYARLAALFDAIATSDLAWARTLRWRAGIARLWPAVRRARRLRVAGPPAEALLLCGWLRSRLRRDVRLAREDAETVEQVEVDGRAVEPARLPALTASDLLSEQLEVYGRDPVYEAAVRAVT